MSPAGRYNYVSVRYILKTACHPRAAIIHSLCKCAIYSIGRIDKLLRFLVPRTCIKQNYACSRAKGFSLSLASLPSADLAALLSGYACPLPLSSWFRVLNLPRLHCSNTWHLSSCFLWSSFLPWCGVNGEREKGQAKTHETPNGCIPTQWAQACPQQCLAFV